MCSVSRSLNEAVLDQSSIKSKTCKAVDLKVDELLEPYVLMRDLCHELCLTW